MARQQNYCSRQISYQKFYNIGLQLLILTSIQDVAFSSLLIGPIISNSQYLLMTIYNPIPAICIYLFQILSLLLLFYFFSNIDFHLIVLLLILIIFSLVLVIVMFLNYLLLYLFISFHSWSLYLVLSALIKLKDSLFIIKLLSVLLNVDYHNQVIHFKKGLFKSFLIAGRNEQYSFVQIHFFNYDLILDSVDLCFQDNCLFISYLKNFILKLNSIKKIVERNQFLNIYLFNFEMLVIYQLIIRLKYYLIQT